MTSWSHECGNSLSPSILGDAARRFASVVSGRQAERNVACHMRTPTASSLILHVLSLCLLLSCEARALEKATPPADYATTMDQQNVDFLRQLAMRIEQTGYRDAKVIPQMFVVVAKRRDGKDITLIVDSNTLKALE